MLLSDAGRVAKLLKPLKVKVIGLGGFYYEKIYLQFYLLIFLI